MATGQAHKPDPATYMDEDEIKQALKDMEQDALLKTSPILVQGPNDSIDTVSFLERHAKYLKDHPKINPDHYLSNLHAMIKIRP